MGALGCSVGPVPSSVVCAKALMENAPANANVKIAELAKDLVFITHLLEVNLTV
jgi:hypothetical protein